jgi:serine/threonine-protein kinase
LFRNGFAGVAPFSCPFRVPAHERQSNLRRVGAVAEPRVPTTLVESLGKYRPIAELAHGGMSRVHLAALQGPGGFNKLVVVKELRGDFAEDPAFVAMFLDEARLAARLHHPNIVQTNEVGQTEKTCFMAMEYLDGQPLASLLRRSHRSPGGLPIALAARIASEVCAGLHYAHELKEYDGTPLDVVHRDVSPQNIFITYDGLTKVVDFGIAKAQGRTVETSIGVLKGKVGYMPPEQAMGLGVDRRADVFALGVVLYEMATMTRMWRRDEVDILRELMSARVPTSPKAIRADVPDEIDRICRRALAPEKRERYATALEMKRDLDAFLDSAGKRATSAAIGELVAALFADDRAKIGELIDRQLRAIADSSGSLASQPISLPTLAIGQTGPSPSVSRVTPVPPRVETIQPPKRRGAIASVGAAAAVVLVAACAAVTIVNVRAPAMDVASAGIGEDAAGRAALAITQSAAAAASGDAPAASGPPLGSTPSARAPASSARRPSFGTMAPFPFPRAQATPTAPTPQAPVVDPMGDRN